MSALLKTEPCETCRFLKTVRSYDIERPDEVVCALTGTDVWDCERTAAAGKLCDIAASFAHQLTEIADEHVRRGLAEAICDRFADAVHDLGGRIDGIEFMRLAGLRERVEA